MQVEILKEHQWLQKLMGDWSTEMEMVMAPDQPPEKISGTETVRSLGGLWMLCEGSSEVPGGGTGKTVMTLGYDSAKKRFVGSFIGSMMTHMWIYEGSVDASGKVLTLDTEGPSFGGDGKMAKYQDIIEFKSEDHRELRSQVRGEDGQWKPFMTAQYRRK